MRQILLATVLVLDLIVGFPAQHAFAETPQSDPATGPQPASMVAPPQSVHIVADASELKNDSQESYPLVPPSAAELAERAATSTKANGAAALASMDLSTPMSANPDLPNYYYYHRHPVPLPLDVTRLAVRLADHAAADSAQLSPAPDLGLDLIQMDPIGIDGWQFVTLAQPLADLEDANQRITTLLSNPSVEFASPVFHSLLVPDGWVVFAQDILVRFEVNHREGAAAAIDELADGFDVKENPLGGMDGAYRLGRDVRNGFEVLAQANRMALDTRVKWAQPVIMCTRQSSITPNDPLFNDTWGIHNTGQIISGISGVDDMDMDGPEAWNITPGAAGVRVMVIETGVQQNHPDLNQDAGRDFTTGTANGVAGGGPGNSCDRHGTAVAGCISGSFDNSIGPVGIAPFCRVVSARVGVAATPCSTSWTGETGWTVNALNWARNQGIQVTNNSNSWGAYESALDDAYTDTYEDGVVHFASSGNSGATSIAFPASAEYVNAVGNLRNNGTLNPSSQTGIGLDFVAPGTSVRTTDVTGANGYDSGDYAWVNGTSFASPYAAGVAALVKVTHPTWSPANVEIAMYMSARDLGAAGYDTSFGSGLVNAYDAITHYNPDNDECIHPTIITGTSYNPGAISTSNATSSTYFEPAESCEVGNVGVSNSVWYSYTPPANGWIDLNTFGSSYDTVLSVFNGCGFYVGTLPFIIPSQLACNDDVSGTVQSEISGLPVNGGPTYYIKVSDYNTNAGGGSLILNLNFHYAPPANDSCLNRTMIPSTSGTTNMPAVNSIGATISFGTCTEPWEHFCGHPDGNSNSVWYGFVPSVSGHINLDTFGSQYDTVLTIFDGSGFGNPCGEYWEGQDGPECVDPSDFGYYACNDDSYAPGWYYQSLIVDYPVTAGWPYLIKVADYNPTSGGGLTYLNTVFYGNATGGDVNGDGQVNAADAPLMAAALLNPANCGCNLAQADMNGDSVVNARDLQPFVDAVMGG